MPRRGNQLKAHRQSMALLRGGILLGVGRGGPRWRTKACGQADRRTAAQGGVDRHLHPAVVSIHAPCADSTRPARVDSKGKDLRTGKRQEIPAIEGLKPSLEEGGTHRARPHQVDGRVLERLINLPAGLGLEQGSLRGIAGMRQQLHGHGALTQAQPCLPERFRIEGDLRRFDHRTHGRKMRQSLPAHIQHPVFHPEVPAQIGQPADLLAAQRSAGQVARRQGHRQITRILAKRQRRLRVIACLGGQQAGDVRHMPTHRAFGAELQEKGVCRR